ncbi:hypothetical protein K1I93_09255 [Streptococcus australis]|uniref:hypothetical protein n=1 Tax=Streptococcus australis TaxID=113107 RepID=UPI001CBC30D1|nr:hypothetical protein [Streptococcus australis]MBZ2160237.1 hypothetical protein [Streptococcus australis]
MALSIRVSDSSKDFAKQISKETAVPKSIQIVNYTTGVMNEGKDNEFPYASLIAVDPTLFEKFESIGQEEHCPTFKVKLKGYRGEDLTPLIGKELTFQEYEIAFVLDKFKQPIGLALVLELDNISIN